MAASVWQVMQQLVQGISDIAFELLNRRLRAEAIHMTIA